METYEGMDSAVNSTATSPEVKPADVCSNCGSPLAEDQAFCPKCGTAKKIAPKKPTCSKCGAELAEGQEFCSKCGCKVDLTLDSSVSSAINQFNAGVQKQNDKKKKTPIVIGVAVVIVILLAIAGAKIAPKIFIDSAGYLEQGNLEKAWEKAKTDEEKQNVINAYLEDGDYEEAFAKVTTDEEKLQIKAENAAAVQSAYSADNLKDPSSFSLRDCYYIESTDDDGDPNAQLVLYISGANSYGASVSSYWLYTWHNDDQKWGYFCSVSDLSDEEYKSYDDADDKLEKLFNNLGRLSIRNTMSDGIKLSKDAVKRINTMFENDTLDRIELLDMNITYGDEE